MGNPELGSWRRTPPGRPGRAGSACGGTLVVTRNTMNKELPDPKVGRKSRNMAVKEADKMVILVPHNVKADGVIMLSDNPPSYDFSELAKLISNADVDRINK